MQQRSSEKEWLDLGSEYYTDAEFLHCQKMLFRVNQMLGCYRETVNILKTCRNDISVMDVGCGGGLFVLHLARQFPAMQFIGNDISAEAIQMAKEEQNHIGKAASNVSFQLLAEPVLAYPDNHVDVVMATMVCHHMTDSELVAFLQQSLRTASHQVIINDLHRHPVAYWFYWLVSPLLFRDRLITHDGLISIKRSFIRSEWETLLHRAGITQYKIKWCFPFRWRVTVWKK